MLEDKPDFWVLGRSQEDFWFVLYLYNKPFKATYSPKSSVDGSVALLSV